MENYYYEKLTEEQRIFYQDLCEGLRHRADKVPAPPGLKRNAFLTAIDAVVVEGYALEPGKKDYGGHAWDLRWPLLLVTEEDPKTGDVLIVDNDNVSADRTDRSTVIGMRGYMAPEIVRSRSRSALRSAILMGDAIGDEEARRAVRGFVKDGDQSIVAVQDSEQIISRIVTATVKTIRGIPQAAAEQDDAPSPAPDAFVYPAGTDAPEFPGGSVLSF